MMSGDLYEWWRHVSYSAASNISSWFLFFLLVTALASWQLQKALAQHNASEREAALAKKAALVYTAGAVVLGLFAWVFG